MSILGLIVVFCFFVFAVFHFEELFGGLPDLTMFSIESVKNKDKGFELEFGALVGCPHKSMKHEMNKLRYCRRINEREKALKNWKWDEVIEIESFGQDSYDDDDMLIKKRNPCFCFTPRWATI
ncbi:hypothetical protein HanOQP8_Chr06g0232381 [Helianthus annuus]|nr:hypothetical protein HanIR_Chr06g0293981 [Helianthus annuus]KAJ0741817.1 hypothetical protein HanOQP8_Chr06g0232381 [Helianthus annuus]KAJ0916658.1 hypothetical protein HanPSC8_Chr06g0264271 [Helianthus annuus]